MNDPNRIQWNKDGQIAAERLRNRGIAKFSSDQYAAEFRTVRAEREGMKAKTAQKYRLNDKPDHGNWRIFQAGDEITEVEVAGSMALTQLTNLVLGLPRNPDHSINIPVALEIINESFSDLGQRASGEYLSTAAMRLIRDQNVQAGHLAGSDPYKALFRDMLIRARSEHPAISRVYDGQKMGAEALSELLWPVIKRQPQSEQFRQRSEVRHYEFNR
jgi:hypothetical protein